MWRTFLVLTLAFWSCLICGVPLDRLVCVNKNWAHVSETNVPKIEVWEDIWGNSQRENKIYSLLRQFAWMTSGENCNQMTLKCYSWPNEVVYQFLTSNAIECHIHHVLHVVTAVKTWLIAHEKILQPLLDILSFIYVCNSLWVLLLKPCTQCAPFSILYYQEELSSSKWYLLNYHSTMLVNIFTFEISFTEEYVLPRTCTP